MEETSEKLPKTKKSSLFTYAKRVLYLLIILALGRWISYVLEEYNAQDGENIFICDEEECFQTTHIHSDITFDLCGETPVLPRESWPLDGLHTHKEKNYLHFHDRVELDRKVFEETGEKKRLREKSLSIQEVLNVYELDPQEYCWTDDVDIEVMINGEIPEAWLEATWVDGDEIKIIFKKK